jgi:hypothetical protein
MKQLIAWTALRNADRVAGLPEPNIGTGIGYAFGLWILLIISSFSIHHFFVRKCLDVSEESHETLWTR